MAHRRVGMASAHPSGHVPPSSQVKGGREAGGCSMEGAKGGPFLTIVPTK